MKTLLVKVIGYGRPYGFEPLSHHNRLSRTAITITNQMRVDLQWHERNTERNGTGYKNGEAKNHVHVTCKETRQPVVLRFCQRQK